MWTLKEDILKFPFPFKLWVIVNVAKTDFLCWTSDGDGIVVDFEKLQKYLASPNSIFVIKTASKFIQLLKEFQFENKELAPTADILLYFQHPCFKRQRLDLVSKVRRVTFFNLDDAQSAELQANKTKSIETATNSAKNFDLCFMQHGVLTKTQMKAIRNATISTFTRESKILQEKLKLSESSSNMNKYRRGRSACLERERSIEIQKNLFVNPLESKLAGKHGIYDKAYGGFYGNLTKEQIEAFFGEYLPTYENGTLKVKKLSDSTDLVGDAEVDDASLDASETSGACYIEPSATTVGKIVEDSASNSIDCIDANTTQVDMIIDESICNAVENTLDESGNIVQKINNISTNIGTELSMNYNVTNDAIEINAMNLNVNGYNEDVVMLEPTENSNDIDDYNDFYDDLRATFELLQNTNF